jgi:hypothetical protein
MWSDSIFLTQDRAKLLFLSRAIEAAYTGGAPAVQSWVNSPTVEISPHLGPKSVSWVQDGERIVLVLGTLSAGEYVSQTNGWVFPRPIGQGVVNSYHASRADMIYPNVPSDTKLIVGHSMGGAIAGLLGRLGAASGLRVIGIGTPRYADAYAVLEPGWAQSAYFADPRDLVSETPALGFGFPLRDWRVPLLEYAVTPDGIVYDVPSPSYESSLAAIASTYGASYHEIGQYVRAFSDPPNFTAMGVPMANSRRVTIRGVFHEQSVINEFWYLPSAGDEDTPAQNLAEAFQQKWSTLICPKVSDAYSVLSYDVRRLYGAVSVNPAAPAEGSTWRWSEQYILNGTSADVGMIPAGTAFPSFVAVGFRKTCGPFKASTGGAVAGLKSPRGGGRISGPAEIITGASGGNRIVAASLSSWVSALNSLLNIPMVAPVAGAWFMSIATYTYAGAPILTGTPPAADWRIASVTGLTVNPFLTSQNSRKQTLSRLG